MELIGMAEDAVLLLRGSFIDPLDGNSYDVVKIGDQIWMAENLKATKYNDGTPIPVVQEILTPATNQTGACCWYDNDITNKDIYGGMYNWYAVATGKLCPAGWHVPSQNEWITLILFLEDDDPDTYIAAGKLKAAGDLESGTGLWKSPNMGATNETGFSALPGGIGVLNDNNATIFCWKSEAGVWWSCTTYGETYPYSLAHPMFWNTGGMNLGYNYPKSDVLSVRCLRD
jgi:uncharacterized protein (TIGR02145 family)